MSKVITFSRKSKHITGLDNRTFFVEKILNTIGVDYKSEKYLEKLKTLNKTNLEKGKLSNLDLILFQDSLVVEQVYSDHPVKKSQTIRKGHRWKAGEYFSPRVWSRKPYTSPQIIFFDDLFITKTNIVRISKMAMEIKENGDILCFHSKFSLAHDDGLKYKDFVEWFNKDFEGQVIKFDFL